MTTPRKKKRKGTNELALGTKLLLLEMSSWDEETRFEMRYELRATVFVVEKKRKLVEDHARSLRIGAAVSRDMLMAAHEPKRILEHTRRSMFAQLAEELSKRMVPHARTDTL